MSRYDDYEDRPQRWDSDRFAREQEQRRGPPVIERERYEEIDRYTRSPPSRPRDNPPDDFYQRRPPPVRYREEERMEFSSRRPPPLPHFFDEEGEDPQQRRDERGQMVPFERRERIVEQGMRAQQRGPRPGLMRRQSSLDTFDRKPMRVRETEVVRLPMRRRPSPPRFQERSPPRFVEREREIDEIRVTEPEFYGDDEYREYREVKETRRRESEVDRREEMPERSFPKRGKTRMPLRLVERKVVIDLGYPFEEDGEVLVIMKALGKEHIDEVIQRSREYRQTEVVKESRTTYTIEAPPPPPRAPEEEKVVETRRVVETREVPASVRDWDEHSARSIRISPSRSGRRARSVSAAAHREVLIVDDEVSESDRRESVGALMVPNRKRRGSRNIAAEIRALELEKKALKLERDSERDREKAERIREGKGSGGGGGGEIIIEKIEREGNVVKIEKDRRGRMNLVVK